MSAFLKLPVAFVFPQDEADDGMGCEGSQIGPSQAPKRAGMVPPAQDVLDHFFHGLIQPLGVCLIGGGKGQLWLSPDPFHCCIQAGVPPLACWPSCDAAALAVCVVPAPDMRAW